MEPTETGTIIEERIPDKWMTWEIYNYYTLSQYCDFFLLSPEFSFAGATWHVVMMLDKCANRNILLHLKRTNFGSYHPRVSCELAICANIDCTYVGTSTRPFIFEGDGLDYSFELFPRSVLDDKKAIIAPEGIIRVLCKLYLEGKSVVDPSQTESLSLSTSALSQDLEKLLQSGDSSDVTIRVNGHDFRAHRAILSARTPVFASMFRVDMMEKNSGIVTIDDCESSAFQDFLYFIYTGRQLSPLSAEKMVKVYALADKYDVAELKSACLEWMKSNLSNETVFCIFALALRYDETELLERASQFFCNNIKKIIKTVDWLKFMSENPKVANELLNKGISDSRM